MKTRYLAQRLISVILSVVLLFGVLPMDGLVVTAKAAGAALSGEGTAESPFLIENLSDWNTFADNVNSQTNADSYYKLTADIGSEADPVIKMVGDQSTTPFQGVLNGNGHTLTVSLSATDEYCAPFRFVDGATIQYLHTAGTVTAGTDTKKDKYRAGLIGNTKGNVTLLGCRSSVSISSEIAGDGTHAGFVAISEGTLNMTNCLFDGSINGANTTNCGGFVGWRSKESIYLKNCYQNGTLSLKPNTSGSATFSRNFTNDKYGTLTNCYYHEAPYGSDGQGGSLDNGASAETMVKNLGTFYWKAEGDKAVPVTSFSNDLEGDGTAVSPFLLKTPDDWTTFANCINAGQYTNASFKMIANIGSSETPVTSIVGANGSAFCGILDGDGHTLTVAIENTMDSATAPFGEIKDGAILQNLTVTGSVTGTTHASGLVGFSRGGSIDSPNTIQNCVVSVNVSVPQTSGNRHMGGVVGHGLKSYLTIEDTIFNGSLSNSGSYAGGLQGWSDGNHLLLYNCLFAGTYTGQGAFHPIAIHNSGSSTVKDARMVYYTALPTLTDDRYLAEGGLFVTTENDHFSTKVKAVDGNSYYTPLTVSGLNSFYLLKDESGVSPSVTVIDPTKHEENEMVLTEGFHYTTELRDENGAVVTLPITDPGSYTLHLIGNNSRGYYGVDSLSFTVVSNLKGTGTNSDPYQIGSEEEWYVFSQSVAEGTDYDGEYLKLTADIQTEEMVGTEQNRFKGNFDGNGHTLTFHADTGAANVAPFRYAEDAVFSHLHVAGTINLSNSNQIHAAGLISMAYGKISVTACRSSITIINEGSDAPAESGGFIAMLNAGCFADFTNCLFDGKLSNIVYTGGFVGEKSSSDNTTLTNCLSAGIIELNNYSNYTFARMGCMADNCYYTQSITPGEYSMKTQGIYTSATGEALAAQLGKSWVVDDDLVIPLMDEKDIRTASLSGIKPFYLYTGDSFEISPILTDLNGISLTAEADYTFSIQKDGEVTDSVKEKGTYTLTITGNGNWHGTLSYSFEVSDPVPVTSALTALESEKTYKVCEDVTFENRIGTGKNVTLILGEGTTMTAKKGIGVNEADSLTIAGDGTLYAGTTDGTDFLCDSYAAAIGHDDAGYIGTSASGRITINGGTIFANGGGSAAGIGGAFHGSGTVIINGGNVTVKAKNGAGIGGGSYSDRGEGSSVTINGGTINVVVQSEGAGIGEGLYGKEGTVTINGGTIHVKAYCHTIGGASSDNKTAITLDYHSLDDSINLSVDKAEDYNMPGIVTIAEGKSFYNQDKKQILTGTVTDKDLLLGTLVPYTETEICEVTFDPANEESTIVKKVPKGENVIAPADPSKEDYSFAGWYTTENERFDFTTKINKDIKLTAHYKKSIL